MTETHQTPPYTLENDDKVAQVMVYTLSSLFWGDVVVKELVRVSTWLRTNTAPDRVNLYNAKMMSTVVANPGRPMQYTELYVSTSQIVGFHLVPPAKDPVDYDPTEPNRRMEPVTLLFSTFRVEGHLRLAGRTTVGKFLEVTHENFTAVYDAQISNVINPAFGVITVPYMIVRQDNTIFAVK